MSGDQTIVSSGGHFALGFFAPGNVPNFVPEKKYSYNLHSRLRYRVTIEFLQTASMRYTFVSDQHLGNLENVSNR